MSGPTMTPRRAPPGAIQQGLDALARAGQAGAMCGVDHHDVHRMRSEDLDHHVKQMLTQGLASHVEEMAHQSECISFSDMPGMDARPSHRTEFRADVVLMKPDDYNHLCRLLRELKRYDDEAGNLTVSHD